jgi:hypothetical protein
MAKNGRMKMNGVRTAKTNNNAVATQITGINAAYARKAGREFAHRCIGGAAAAAGSVGGGTCTLGLEPGFGSGRSLNSSRRSPRVLEAATRAVRSPYSSMSRRPALMWSPNARRASSRSASPTRISGSFTPQSYGREAEKPYDISPVSCGTACPPF